ncbi:sensor histidine kinase [Pseudomonas oryzihabitans]|uniref:sensor histidine kinase n=1 Tax=Pseudomonas oryzihabitans TaxID=47885 RepID=UPI002860217E|nr:ATP-binding protein [Pseudomonas psychrotolerans]MDR6676641.1 two-component system C4-dicarboxylate transport sensor histidine kinase DctB [Pseudomonas psychrotolerans]
MPPALRLLPVLLLALLGGLLVSGLAWQHAERATLNDASLVGQEQLRLHASGLQTLIDRFRALPAVLAQDPELIAVLTTPPDAAATERLNLKLERLNAAAQSSTLELLDRTGLAIGASNWRLPVSYVGHNYSFRPYFRETLAGGSGRFYAVGVTTGIPGYFLSHAVVDAQGRFLGAVVVKLEFPVIEARWGEHPEVLLVSDARGVVFAANRPDWRYRLLRELTPADRAELATTRQYDRRPLRPLVHRERLALGEQRQVARIEAPEGTADYLWDSLPLPSEGWTLHLLRPTRDLPGGGLGAALAAGCAWLLLVCAVLLLVQRRRLQRLRQRSRAELERLVEARTAELRTAQDGLVQAAKLAALGQMSAALVHELNQPLTAQRMHLASLRLLLDHDRLDEARAALERLDALLTRMSGLTGHLKTYARKTPAGLRERVDLALVVDQALELLEARCAEVGAELVLDLPRPAWLLGDPIRLEQVLVNLLRNALDAVAERPAPRVLVRLRRDGDNWQLEVADNGGGIAREHLDQVFDPFFTTKPVGEGLGLGLAVSSAIVQAQSGQLTVTNGVEGAVFRLRLPVAPEPS